MTVTRRTFACGALALLAGSAVFAADQAGPASGGSSLACELHVSGAGYPARLAKARSSMFVTVSPPPAGYNSFDTVNRATELPDDPLRQLFAPGASVTIVRHPEMIDQDKQPIKRQAGRLYPSRAPCYADLVVTKATAIWPNPNVAYSRAGAIGALLVGGNRAVVTFWMQTHMAGTKSPERLQKKFDSPLASPPADINSNPARMRDSMASATADTLKQFVAFVRKKRATG